MRYEIISRGRNDRKEVETTGGTVVIPNPVPNECEGTREKSQFSEIESIRLLPRIYSFALLATGLELQNR